MIDFELGMLAGFMLGWIVAVLAVIVIEYLERTGRIPKNISEVNEWKRKKHR